MKGNGRSLNDFILKMEPRTNITTKQAPPNNAPMTSSGLPCIIPAMAANMSGDPLPNAIKVTPATLCDMESDLEIMKSAGQRKSVAATPREINKINVQTIEITIAIHWSLGSNVQ